MIAQMVTHPDTNHTQRCLSDSWGTSAFKHAITIDSLEQGCPTFAYPRATKHQGRELVGHKGKNQPTGGAFYTGLRGLTRAAGWTTLL
jgi:hypothetical protein